MEKITCNSCKMVIVDIYNAQNDKDNKVLIKVSSKHFKSSPDCRIIKIYSK